MKFNFSKIHGAGNDFILVNGLKYKLTNYNDLAKNLCDRHFGIGADGLIIVLPPEDDKNDFKMRIFNPDGSEAEMCGNGIRCFARFLHEEKLTEKKILKVETLAGIIKPELIISDKKVSQVQVNMGKPRFKPDEIPIKINDDLEYVQNYDLIIDDKSFKINCVSMGNPHTVIFTDQELKFIPLEKWGKKIENHNLFPAKTNVEFIKVITPEEINMRVWERGTGITLACGTGASAAVVAGIKNKLLKEEVLVHLPGGDLKIKWHGEDVFMTGPAKTVYQGSIEI